MSGRLAGADTSSTASDSRSASCALAPSGPFASSPASTAMPLASSPMPSSFSEHSMPADSTPLRARLPISNGLPPSPGSTAPGSRPQDAAARRRHVGRAAHDAGRLPLRAVDDVDDGEPVGLGVALDGDHLGDDDAGEGRAQALDRLDLEAGPGQEARALVGVHRALELGQLQQP